MDEKEAAETKNNGALTNIDEKDAEETKNMDDLKKKDESRVLVSQWIERLDFIVHEASLKQFSLTRSLTKRVVELKVMFAQTNHINDTTQSFFTKEITKVHELMTTQIEQQLTQRGFSTQRHQRTSSSEQPLGFFGILSEEHSSHV